MNDKLGFALGKEDPTMIGGNGPNDSAVNIPLGFDDVRCPKAPYGAGYKTSQALFPGPF